MQWARSPRESLALPCLALPCLVRTQRADIGPNNEPILPSGVPFPTPSVSLLGNSQLSPPSCCLASGMEADKRGSMPRVMELGEACSTAKASSAEAARTEARLRKMVVGEKCARAPGGAPSNSPAPKPMRLHACVCRDCDDSSLCADCKRVIDHRTAWASINLGAFVCIQCSGIHRAIGVHLSKVRAVAADDWNDDWVDNMERWGNARAGAFWEAAAPAHRPTGAGSEVASRAVADYIRAKYDQRLFAISGIEPGAWLRSTTLANGWSRFLDEGSNEWYYSRGDETTWDLPADAAPPPQQPAEWWAGHEGWLVSQPAVTGLLRCRVLALLRSRAAALLRSCAPALLRCCVTALPHSPRC